MNQQQKMEYIMKHYIRLMHSAANEILKDHYESEDACQETFLKLIRVLDQIEDITTVSARAYCVAAARNTALDMVRKNCHMVPVELVFDDAESAATYDAYPSNTGAMMEEIDGLPRIYRDIIRMHCLEDKSPVEIAEELGTCISTVYSRISRARDLLRKKWDLSGNVTCGA